MLVSVTRCVAAAAFIATAGAAVPVSAAPIGSGLALKTAAPALTETVQWRGRGYGWRGGGYWRSGSGRSRGGSLRGGRAFGDRRAGV